MDLSKHLAFFRRIDPKNLPGDFGARFADFITDLQQGTSNTEQQTNANPKGQPKAPPAPNGVQITAQNGYVHVAIQHTSNIFRGINYHLEHDSSPAFTNPIPEDLGTSRHFTHFIGNQTRYYRVAASYGLSGPSGWVYVGSQAQPTAVSGGGSNSGPAFLRSQGSGTGLGSNGTQAAQGLQGPGSLPFRSATGAPPVR